MTPAQRTRRMLEMLPLFLQRGGNIRLILDVLGQGFGEMEGGVTRLMRSRWHTLAQGFSARDTPMRKAESELGRLAALYGLYASRDERDDAFRRHLAALVGLHRVGLTTAPALLQLVAMVYLAEQTPEISWEGRVAVGQFEVREPDGSRRAVRVELVDNPLSPASARFTGAKPGQWFVISNAGLDTTMPELSLTAPADRDVAVPILTQQETGLNVIFVGVVPRKATLTLRHQRVPLIDGTPSQAPVILASPTRFVAQGTLNTESRFGERGAPRARFSVFDEQRSLPTLPPGESRWSYDTLDRATLQSYVPGWPAALINTALTVKSSPPVDLALHWTEVAAATFVLRIPADYVPPRYRLKEGDTEAPPVPGLPGLVRDLARALEYGRAAGVRPRIEFTLTLPPEALELAESTARIETSQSFSEALEVKDPIRAVGQAVEFKETLPEMKERLSWSGTFNATRFNTSVFK
ncbi:hypothetical protein [Vitiosangium sp. GDMCC 1.1324]|uniref:hypothetical protein n=1 Tax=Vitiosangium sp. (strain GDMCC 1.1324) TaxID=2138576 RepID=UPI000D333A70|nr:hypothetical protein [Vitiosangium sp. GDMCC 1.1324]PTL80168.1 hypothetical protein DAT35_29595 [Vitiosangium sp. GDMCC 1.1324]